MKRYLARLSAEGERHNGPVPETYEILWLVVARNAAEAQEELRQRLLAQHEREREDGDGMLLRVASLVLDMLCELPRATSLLLEESVQMHPRGSGRVTRRERPELAAQPDLQPGDVYRPLVEFDRRS